MEPPAVPINNDTDRWINYLAALRVMYHNDREAADVQVKLGQLKYQGSICTYLTEFRALNNYARATDKELQETIDLAMPDSILDMRFNQNPEDLVEDEHFLQATKNLHPDADCHSICLPDGAWQGIFLLDTSRRRVSWHHGHTGCQGTEHCSKYSLHIRKHAVGSRHSDSIQFYSLYLMYIYICYYHTSHSQRKHPA